MNIAGYGNDAKLRVGGGVKGRSLRERFEPKPESVVRGSQDTKTSEVPSRQGRAPSFNAPDIVQLWQNNLGELKAAIESAEAPLEKARIEELLNGSLLAPNQCASTVKRLHENNEADHRVVNALNAAGIDTTRSGKEDTSVLVGMVSGVAVLNRKSRVQKSVFPSDREEEQQKMLASLAAYCRFGAPPSAGFDVWLDVTGRELPLMSLRDGLADITSAIESLRRYMLTVSEGAAEIIFVGLEVFPVEGREAYLVKTHLVVQNDEPADIDALCEVISEKLGYELEHLSNPTLSEIEHSMFQASDMRALSRCDPERIARFAEVIDKTKFQRPSGGFRSWRASDAAKESQPLLLWLGDDLNICLIRKKPRSNDVDDEVIEGEEEKEEEDEESEAAAEESDGSGGSETALSKPKFNLKSGHKIDRLPGVFFFEPVAHIRNYLPNSSDADDQRRLAECVPKVLIDRFEAAIGLSTDEARRLNLILNQVSDDLSKQSNTSALQMMENILAGPLEPKGSDGDFEGIRGMNDREGNSVAADIGAQAMRKDQIGGLMAPAPQAVSVESGAKTQLHKKRGRSADFDDVIEPFDDDS